MEKLPFLSGSGAETRPSFANESELIKNTRFLELALMERVVNSQNLGYEKEV
jgi:hypothetical protein